MDQPHLTVLLFAALRDAAGTGSVDLPAPTTVGEVTAELVATFGSDFARRLQAAAVMVDGVPAPNEPDHVLHPGAEVALLPPFAGG